jgi:hypothetical protein
VRSPGAGDPSRLIESSHTPTGFVDRGLGGDVAIEPVCPGLPEDAGMALAQDAGLLDDELRPGMEVLQRLVVVGPGQDGSYSENAVVACKLGRPQQARLSDRKRDGCRRGDMENDMLSIGREHAGEDGGAPEDQGRRPVSRHIVLVRIHSGSAERDRSRRSEREQHDEQHGERCRRCAAHVPHQRPRQDGTAAQAESDGQGTVRTGAAEHRNDPGGRAANDGRPIDERLPRRAQKSTYRAVLRDCLVAVQIDAPHHPGGRCKERGLLPAATEPGGHAGEQRRHQQSIRHAERSRRAEDRGDDDAQPCRRRRKNEERKRSEPIDSDELNLKSNLQVIELKRREQQRRDDAGAPQQGRALLYGTDQCTEGHHVAGLYELRRHEGEEAGSRRKGKVRQEDEPGQDDSVLGMLREQLSPDRFRRYRPPFVLVGDRHMVRMHRVERRRNDPGGGSSSDGRPELLQRHRGDRREKFP